MAKTILQGKVEGTEEGAGGKKDGKTTSRTGLFLASQACKGQLKTEQNSYDRLAPT